MATQQPNGWKCYNVSNLCGNLLPKLDFKKNVYSTANNINWPRFEPVLRRISATTQAAVPQQMATTNGHNKWPQQMATTMDQQLVHSPFHLQRLNVEKILKFRLLHLPINSIKESGLC